MECYIGDIRLPVPVETISVKTGADVKTVSLVKGGEIGFFGGKKLDTVSFSSFYPSSDRSYCQYSGFPSVQTFVDTIQKAKDEGNPVRFILTGTDMNNLFLIDTFDKDYKENGRGDLSFSISFTEYRDIEIPQIAPAKNDKPSSSEPTKRPTDKKETPKNRTHIVKRGDTLWGLAKKYYGNGNQYMKIFNANKDKIKNPNLIIDGWKLVIP